MNSVAENSVTIGGRHHAVYQCVSKVEGSCVWRQNHRRRAATLNLQGISLPVISPSLSLCWIRDQTNLSLSPSRLFSLSLPPSLSSHHVQHRPSFLLHHFLHLPPSSPDFPSRFGLRPSKPSWSLILKPCPPPGFFTLSLHVNVHTTEKYWRKFPVHFVRSLKSCRTADSQEFLLRDLL